MQNTRIFPPFNTVRYCIIKILSLPLGDIILIMTISLILYLINTRNLRNELESLEHVSDASRARFSSNGGTEMNGTARASLKLTSGFVLKLFTKPRKEFTLYFAHACH